MPYSSGIISAPVSMSDVRGLFGRSDTDLDALINNVSLNRWAKYKPVQLGVYDTVTGQWDATNQKWRSTATWWRGNTTIVYGNPYNTVQTCGFQMKVFTGFGLMTNTHSFLYNLKNGLLGWQSVKPTGGSDSPYRLQDFGRYNHNAIRPFGEIAATRYILDITNSFTMQWDIIYIDDETNLRLSDIAKAAFGDRQFYFGVLLWDPYGSTYWTATASTPFVEDSEDEAGGDAMSITFSGVYSMGSPTGKRWDMLPFFSTQRKDPTGSEPSDVLLLITPITTAYQLTIFSYGNTVTYEPMAQWNANNNGIQVYCYVTNNFASPHTVGRLTFYIYRTTGPSPSEVGGSYVTSFSPPSSTDASFTLQGGETKVIPAIGEYIDSPYIARGSGYTYWIGARDYNDTAGVNTWWQIEEHDTYFDD